MARIIKRFHWIDLAAAALIIGLAVLGCSLLGRALTWGVWAYSDSAEYIVSARMLVSGRGLGLPTADGGFMPLSLHPPLYPLVISAFVLAGTDPLDALPVFNLILFAATALISGGLIYALTRDPLLAVSACALTVLPAAMLRNFDGAMTEPLYIPLSISVVVLLAWYWKRGRRSLIVAAGILAGLAGLVRYTGLALLAAGMLVILLSGHPLRQRLKDLALFALLGGGPLLVWFIYLYLQSGLLAARTFTTGGLGDKVFLLRKGVIETLVSWVPYLNRAESWATKALAVYALIGASLVLAGLATWNGFRRKASLSRQVESSLKLMLAALISAAAYLGFMTVSFLFSSVTPDINERTLAPLLPLLVIFLSAISFAFPRAFSWPRMLRIVPLLLVVVASHFFFMQTRSLANDRDAASRGYAAPRWRESALMDVVRELPPDMRLISNVPVAVLLHTGRMPNSILELEEKQVLPDPVPFGSGGDPAEEVFRQGKAALILFQPELQEQMGEIYGERGDERAGQFTAGLKLFRQTQDGAIYSFE